MIETVPDIVDNAFLYFHSARSWGGDIAPFVDMLRAELLGAYVCASARDGAGLSGWATW
ncbi:MAG: hypothetical protein JXB30_13025 [Anaerolineae bacterium]|nr:hypothetical protein [Anaerolineae bacterium]